ncbi:MAG: hypothetical protein Kow0092_10570 [Deferrisomatales bacterium]
MIDRKLLARVGGLQIEYLTGPFRKGFHVRAHSQGTRCSPEGCSP